MEIGRVDYQINLAAYLGMSSRMIYHVSERFETRMIAPRDVRPLDSSTVRHAPHYGTRFGKKSSRRHQNGRSRKSLRKSSKIELANRFNKILRKNKHRYKGPITKVNSL
jgi:hypothetical protein